MVNIVNVGDCKRLIEIGGPIRHEEDANNGNLGYGHLYYGIVRVYRPKMVVAIGSGKGFVPMCLALGCRDNGFGHTHFVDPSFGHDTWAHPELVKKRFESVGLDQRWITHYKMTDRQFAEHTFKASERTIDLLFIDGSDHKEDVEYDFYTVGGHVKQGGFILMHDTETGAGRPYHWGSTYEHIVAEKCKQEPDKYDIIRFPGHVGFSIFRILA